MFTRVIRIAAPALVAAIIVLLWKALASETIVRDRTPISRAPAFSTTDLAALPAEDWITNGGSLSNMRYSPLSEINATNVANLKGVWLTHLLGSAVSAKYSAESQPLEYRGVIYVSTGADDVFAVNADTGKILWQYQAHLDDSISVVCCGWLSRGVALGDGKVYIGQLDGKLVALDQATGNVVWSTQVERWQDGYSITSAPLYTDGMVVTGISGGENEVRGSVTAYDATTGKKAWRFYTIPGPSEPGHETWPQSNDAWQHGAGTVWQTPTVDPKLGLLYFSTGNAGPDNDGSRRAGKNLFTASMVAVDVKTGKLRWYYQLVHHDIWDSDATSPTVLFDATIDGRTVNGIGEAEKTGWLYLLDRTNGKPIFPIVERPVPQDARQKTWSTQPFPTTVAFIPQTVTPAQIKAVERLATSDHGHPVKYLVAKQMFTPFWHTMTITTPGWQGGANWTPSSYSPKTHMFYVCAGTGIAGDIAETVPPRVRKPGEPQPVNDGSEPTIVGFGKNAGTFSAIDVTTGKIVWQKQWPESCYSGSAVTAGNVVFVGRNSGELQAYNATDGAALWSFQTGAGANNVPTIFRRNGHEYVAFYAGGNGLAGTSHGDNLWLFALNGTLGPVAAGEASQAIQHAGVAQNSGPAGPPNAANGAAVFANNCAVCHGASGLGGNGGPNLATIPSAKNFKTVLSQVTNGGGGMPAFKGTLSQQQMLDVSAFVVQKITHGK